MNDNSIQKWMVLAGAMLAKHKKVPIVKWFFGFGHNNFIP